MNKEFLVTGTGRSGTGYMSEFFTNLGYPIGHELMGEYGISSWVFAVSCNEPPPELHNMLIVPTGKAEDIAQGRRGYVMDSPSLRQRGDTFNHIINVVRNPIHVVRSFATYWPPKEAYEFRKQFIYIEEKSNILTQAIQLYIGWHRLVKALNPDLTIKLENASETIPKYLQKNGYEIPDPITYPPKNVNSKPKKHGGENKELTLEHVQWHTSEETFYEFNKEVQFYEKLD